MSIETSYKMNLRHFTKMDKIEARWHKCETHTRVVSKEKQRYSHKMEVRTLNMSALFIQVLSYNPLPYNNTTLKRALKKRIYYCFSHFCWLMGLSETAPTLDLMKLQTDALQGCSRLIQLSTTISKGAASQASISGLCTSFGFHTTWVLGSSRKHPKASIPRDPGRDWKPSYHLTSEVIQLTSAKAASCKAHPYIRGWRKRSMF